MTNVRAFSPAPLRRLLVRLTLAVVVTAAAWVVPAVTGQLPTWLAQGWAAPTAYAAERRAADDDHPEEALHPEDNPEAVRKAYLTLLFQEVNVRRDHAASPPFEMMLDTGNEAVNLYLVELTPLMEQRRACFHGSDVTGLRAGWDYLPDFGVQNQVGGEVLACPDVDAGGFWTPPGIADGWWRSPHHFHTLYADPRPNAVACGAYNQVVGKNAYETVACITLLPDPLP